VKVTTEDKIKINRNKKKHSARKSFAKIKRKLRK